MARTKSSDAESLGLIPDTTAGAGKHDLEKYIGTEIRKHRRRMDMTMVALAQRANVLQGMMSKISAVKPRPSGRGYKAL